MFWGLILEPRRRYTQLVKRSFHISMAALDAEASDGKPAQVLCGSEGKNFLLCTLVKNKVNQCHLDLNFEIGDSVSFATNGSSHVHLTGYLNDLEAFGDSDGSIDVGELPEVGGDLRQLIKGKKEKIKRSSEILENNGPVSKKLKQVAPANDEDDDDDLSDSDFNLDSALNEDSEENSTEEEEDEVEGEEDDDDDVDDEEDEDDEVDVDVPNSSDEEEDDEETNVPEITPKKKTSAIQLNGSAKKNAGSNTNQMSNNASSQANKTVKPKSPGKKDNDNLVTPNKDKTPKDKKQQSTPHPKRKVLPQGVVVEDIVEGSGEAATNGKFIYVYYEGRLKQNNKVFDSTKQGLGFGFRLGKNEVIKGWDIGIQGMKIGGKRKIVCPPHAAYGTKGSPPVIPPSSTLIFEVELKKVK